MQFQLRQAADFRTANGQAGHFTNAELPRCIDVEVKHLQATGIQPGEQFALGGQLADAAWQVELTQHRLATATQQGGALHHLQAFAALQVNAAAIQPQAFGRGQTMGMRTQQLATITGATHFQAVVKQQIGATAIQGDIHQAGRVIQSQFAQFWPLYLALEYAVASFQQQHIGGQAHLLEVDTTGVRHYRQGLWRIQVAEVKDLHLSVLAKQRCVAVAQSDITQVAAGLPLSQQLRRAAIAQAGELYITANSGQQQVTGAAIEAHVVELFTHRKFDAQAGVAGQVADKTEVADFHQQRAEVILWHTKAQQVSALQTHIGNLPTINPNHSRFAETSTLQTNHFAGVKDQAFALRRQGAAQALVNTGLVDTRVSHIGNGGGAEQLQVALLHAHTHWTVAAWVGQQARQAEANQAVVAI